MRRVEDRESECCIRDRLRERSSEEGAVDLMQNGGTFLGLVSYVIFIVFEKVKSWRQAG